MLYTIRRSKVFERSLRRIKRSGNVRESTFDVLADVISSISRGENLEYRFRDHALQGVYEGLRECHIQSDLLLVYEIDEQDVLLVLVNIGSHSHIFG